LSKAFALPLAFLHLPSAGHKIQRTFCFGKRRPTRIVIRVDHLPLRRQIGSFFGSLKKWAATTGEPTDFSPKRKIHPFLPTFGLLSNEALFSHKRKNARQNRGG